MKSVIALASLAFALGVSANRYHFRNDCPDAVRLRYYKSDHSIELQPRKKTVSDSDGVYYINPDDEGNYQDALQVVFGAREDGSTFYYVLKPADKRLHVGIAIKPLPIPSPAWKNGQCSAITCDSIDCEAALDKQKDVKGTSPLVHICGEKEYEIILCPTKKYAAEPESDETRP